MYYCACPTPPLVLCLARTERGHFNPQHWLLCHVGLYEFDFEFGEEKESGRARLNRAEKKSLNITNVIIEAMVSYDYEMAGRFGEYLRMRPFWALEDKREVQI